MKIFSFYFVVVLLFSGCIFNSNTTTESSIPGTWHLYDVEPLKGKGGGDSFSKNANLKKAVKEGAILCLFEDGSYSDVKGDGEFKTGKWKFSQENKSISFIDSGRASDPVKIKLEKNINGKQILTLSMEKRNVALKFIKESESLKEFTSDPFYASNNKWRIKPDQPENSTALTNRLANYFKHLALILKAAKERKQDIVSFEFSPGPVKIYNGGIGIHPYAIVPVNWKNSFYDEGDAATAYRKYEEYLKTSSYKGAGTGDWIEDDYKILLIIYSDISQSVPKGNQ